LPDSEYYYEFLISYYLTKKEYDKLQEINDSAYLKYPHNWTFVYYKAIFAVRALRNHEQAISTLEAYLGQDIDISPLSTLADIYLQASDIAGWEKTYERIFEYDLAAVGYYFQVANDYYKLRNFELAEKMIMQAISICPNSSAYWALLGDIKRAQGDMLLARENYEKSLKYDKADYDTREKLRKLEGKDPIFDHFEKTNLETIISEAPGKDLYPGVKALVLFRNANRVVYPEGTSESMEELLVRVFNKRGIDDFKEFWISHNRYTEGLTIEKAVVIKRDGSEVKADTKLNQIVFKSLEEEDFIYVKWRLKNYYNGKLSEHFWDKFYFNGTYPMEKVTYSLLIPKDFKFSYSTLNMDITPEIKNTEDGNLYIWRDKNVSSIGFEHAMPGIDDVGRVLYITSIEDWAYLVEWYNDLAKTRTRSSFEIKETVADLFKGRENLNQEAKIRIIYDYITENIRYSHVPFRQSGLIPQKARDVLVTKIGDCKDTSTLCIAMLKEVDIDAHKLMTARFT
jgi:tetratricopeptide (TPR) repeat protein